MNLVIVIQYLFIFMVCSSAIAALLVQKIMHSAFFVVISLLGVAALYAMLGADFLSVTQILLYTGGIMVVVVFALMLSDGINLDSGKSTKGVLKFIVPITVFGSLSYLILTDSDLNKIGGIQQDSLSTIRTIGKTFMTENIIHFEIIALLLLVVLILALYISSLKPTDNA